MIRSLIIPALLLFALLVPSCMEDSLVSSHTTEMYYVDLLYAIHHHDQAGAKEAAQQFTKNFSEFHFPNNPLRPEDETENMRFHLSKAEQTYMEIRASIEQNKLEQAMIQLDRATYELKAARVPGLEELYIANIYDFLQSWLEVSRTTYKENLSSREWQAINRQIKNAHTTWRHCQGYRPSPELYYFSEEDTKGFNKAHSEVDRLMDLLKESLSENDEVLTKSYVDATDSAVWGLVRRFGSPKENGLDLIPTEI